MANPFVAAPLRSHGLARVAWSARGFDAVAADPAAVVARIERDRGDEGPGGEEQEGGAGRRPGAADLGVVPGPVHRALGSVRAGREGRVAVTVEVTQAFLGAVDGVLLVHPAGPVDQHQLVLVQVQVLGGLEGDLGGGEEEHLPAVDLGKPHPQTGVVADDPRPQGERDDLVEGPEGTPGRVRAGQSSGGTSTGGHATRQNGTRAVCARRPAVRTSR